MPAASFQRSRVGGKENGTSDGHSAPRVPPIKLDLRDLTDREEIMIMEVIKRDERERAILESKISEVRREIQELRKAGALVSGDDPANMCARCKAKIAVGGAAKILPWVGGERAERCVVCKFLVCPKCRSRGASGTWTCVLCLKYRQEKLLTGECFSPPSLKPEPMGSDLLRQSLRDRSTSTDVNINCSKLNRNQNYNSNDFKVISQTVRDSDSGVNSGTTSRTTTPEQRGQQHQLQPQNQQFKKQQQQLHQQQQQQQQQQNYGAIQQKGVPSIAVTATASVDEDSRESIYSVYSDAGEAHYGRIPVTGDIQFHMSYDYKNSVLLVHVKQCRNLAPVDVKRNRSDPYVKTYLLPDKSRAGKRKTKIKKHTLNPTFDEVLKYNISKPELESRVLFLAVWHNDRLGGNDFLGEVTVPLDYYRFDDASPQWYQLAERVPPQEDMSLMVYKGDLFVSLMYLPPDMVENSPAKKKSGGSFRKKDKDRAKDKPSGTGELHVLVREAQNLTAMRGAAGSNPFCKGYLLPDVSHASKQKTPVLKKTTNPQWNHTLIFPGADMSVLADHGLELTIWDHEALVSNDFLGGVRLNLGSGICQGRPVEWMDARGEEVDAWQAMMDQPGQWVDAQLPLRASMGGQQVKK